MLPAIPAIISLVAAIVPELLSVFGRKNEAEIAGRIGEVAREVAGYDSTDMDASAIKQDPALALQFKQAVLAQQTELAQLAFAHEKLYVDDVQDARK
jgi:hypothetical protein